MDAVCEQVRAGDKQEIHLEWPMLYDAIIIFEILQIIGSLYFFCYVPHCLQALVCSFSRFKRAGIEGPTPTMFMTTSKKCLKRLA